MGTLVAPRSWRWYTTLAVVSASLDPRAFSDARPMNAYPKYESILYLITAFACVAACGSIAHAADGPDAAAVSGLAKGWIAFYGSEPKAAAVAVDHVITSRVPSARLTALHIKARSLWLTGDPASRQAAHQIWSQLATEAQGDKETLARLAIAKSLDLAARGDDRNAIATLEAGAKDGQYSSAAIEIAIELAILHAKAGRGDAAEAALAAAAKELEKSETYGIPKPIADAFSVAIRTTRESLGSPAKALFLRALGMQRDKQFPQAITLFEEVSQKYPGTDEDHRSQFEIGSCYEGLSQTPKAIEHWRKFTASVPAAPWRGQAFVRLIDSALVDRLDLNEAVTYAEQAKLAMASALANAAARASWQETGYPLSLRVGTVALCRNRGPDAIAAFEQARGHAKTPAFTERIDALVAAAKNPSGVIPEDCRAAGSSPTSTTSESTDTGAASLALSLGTIFHVAGESRLAGGLFDRVRGAPAVPASRGKPGKPALKSMPGATPAQVAFASFGKGAVLQAEKKPDQASEAFATALRGYRDAPWHDETLYRVAMASTTPGAALPYWRMLLEKFPETPRREFVLDRYADALWDHAEGMAAKAAGASITAADSSKIDQVWEDVSAALAKLSDGFPDGPYSGTALVKQIDISLERTFDLEGADTACKRAIAWLGQSSPPTSLVANATAAVLPVWAAPLPPPPEVARDALGFRIYVAAGLVAHLQERNDEAVTLFSKAASFDKSRRQEIGAETSMARMISVIEGKSPEFSPHEMLKALKKEKQRTGVLLADLALLTFDPERAGSLYERLLAGQPPFGAPSTELEAYLILRMGQALEFQRKHDEAVAMLTRLYEPKYAKYSWASDGIFRLGTWNHNATQKTATAMPHWEHVFTKTPDHPEAERALFYFAINARRDADHERAEKAFRMYLERYPDSRWTARIRDRELPGVVKLMESERK